MSKRLCKAFRTDGMQETKEAFQIPIGIQACDLVNVGSVKKQWDAVTKDQINFVNTK